VERLSICLSRHARLSVDIDLVYVDSGMRAGAGALAAIETSLGLIAGEPEANLGAMVQRTASGSNRETVSCQHHEQCSDGDRRETLYFYM